MCPLENVIICSEVKLQVSRCVDGFKFGPPDESGEIIVIFTVHPMLRLFTESCYSILLGRPVL